MGQAAATNAIRSSKMDALANHVSVADSLRLAALIHEGVLEPQPWARFLRALRLRLGARYIYLILRRPDSPEEPLEWSDGEGDVAADIRESYARHAIGLDPIRYFQMEPGRALGLSDLIGPNYRSHPFYVVFLKPNRLEHIFFLRMSEASGHQIWLAVAQPANGKAFPGWARDLSELLAPHLTIALQRYAELEAARITQETLDHVTGKLHFGCVTVDAARLVVRRDRNGMRALQAGNPLRIAPDGKLRLTNAIADRELSTLLVHIKTGSLRVPRAIVSDEPERLEILVVPIRPGMMELTSTIATIYFQLPSELQAPNDGRSRRLQELFGLTATEARFALALCEGKSLVEAAAEMPITVESARIYSKRVFAKTGVGRQADLVRLVLKSIANLA